MLQLVEVGLMLLVAGALLRTALTASDDRVTLAYLFAGVTATLSGIVVTAWASDPVTGEYPLWVDLLWVLAYLCLAAGALHPSARSLTVPEGIRRDEVGDRRLLALAVALSAAPLLIVVSRFFAYKPDALVLAVGTLLAIPLTMLRFRQLALRRRAAEQSLAHRAAHDELTGLPNRRAMVDAVTAGLVERRDIAVVICELDINTGTDGDALTRAAAARLTASLRGSDVVGRFGGHEFLVLSTGTSAPEGAAIVRRLEEAFGEPLVVGEAQVAVGATLGVAVAGPHDTADSLVASADAALYRRRRRHQ
jgi:diguanylate cyclase (GGDEF)-like protein